MRSRGERALDKMRWPLRWPAHRPLKRSGGMNRSLGTIYAISPRTQLACERQAGSVMGSPYVVRSWRRFVESGRAS